MKSIIILTSLTIALISSFRITVDDNSTPSRQQSNYFPDNSKSAWETISPSELKWKQENIKPLTDYLELKNTKGFIVLVNGRIAMEYYMNGHSPMKLWYWASAGKTLTSVVTGIAVDKNFVNLDAKVSNYLGNGWTNAPIEKENLITSKKLLTMTSGLKEEGNCLNPECLKFAFDAGTSWDYQNVFVKLQDVIASATKQSWDDYFNSALKDKIGMDGRWIYKNGVNVYWSNTRSMARFGLLALNNGRWKNDQIVSADYMKASTSSNNINESYGYLWWLNGKENYMLPTSQRKFTGSLIPNAPADMFMAMGLNDQKIYIIPSRNMVIVRMGQSASNKNFALSDFDKVLWEKINAVIKNP